MEIYEGFEGGSVGSPVSSANVPTLQFVDGDTTFADSGRGGTCVSLLAVSAVEANLQCATARPGIVASGAWFKIVAFSPAAEPHGTIQLGWIHGDAASYAAVHWKTYGAALAPYGYVTDRLVLTDAIGGGSADAPPVLNQWFRIEVATDGTASAYDANGNLLLQLALTVLDATGMLTTDMASAYGGIATLTLDTGPRLLADDFYVEPTPVIEAKRDLVRRRFMH